ncbi:CGH_1_HP_G0101390.mRNA.1.CDS.1 [Saccharomyces cerevisiae]|nr:CGH_1_HP_G0101390.mRNA.1.CDS.1 [Saccharomyces cerevisiae]CAI6948356.1 CGH_1_HP_G0101390.mRNA.1.CDS.1 [Saccharomyces cerevisiae]
MLVAVITFQQKSTFQTLLLLCDCLVRKLYRAVNSKGLQPCLLKVAVVSASGKVGRLLINQLKANDSFSTPLAIVRTQDQVNYFKNEVGVDASLTDIENASVSEITDAIKAYDAVVFSAPVRVVKEWKRIFTVDLDGCIKVS